MIIREDLLNDDAVFAPMLDYRLQAKNDSLYNTPPTYAIYIAKLVFEWLEELGGIPAILEQDRQKRRFYTKRSKPLLFTVVLWLLTAVH